MASSKRKFSDSPEHTAPPHPKRTKTKPDHELLRELLSKELESSSDDDDDFHPTVEEEDETSDNHHELLTQPQPLELNATSSAENDSVTNDFFSFDFSTPSLGSLQTDDSGDDATSNNDLIASRTRRRQPLYEKNIEEIAAALRRSPSRSPTPEPEPLCFDDDPDFLEYIKFLSELNPPESIATETSVANDANQSNTSIGSTSAAGDQRILLKPVTGLEVGLSLVSGNPRTSLGAASTSAPATASIFDDDDDDDPDYRITEEEERKIQLDREEYRTDPAVRVSQKELQILLHEGQGLPPLQPSRRGRHPRNHKGLGTFANTANLKPIRPYVPQKLHSAAAPSTAGIPTHLAVNPAALAFSTQSTSSPGAGAIGSSAVVAAGSGAGSIAATMPGIRGLIPPMHQQFSPMASYQMTENQIQTLYSQLNDHFQLLVQTFLLSIKYHNHSEDSDFSSSAALAFRLLYELKQARDNARVWKSNLKQQQQQHVTVLPPTISLSPAITIDSSMSSIDVQLSPTRRTTRSQTKLKSSNQTNAAVSVPISNKNAAQSQLAVIPQQQLQIQLQQQQKSPMNSLITIYDIGGLDLLDNLLNAAAERYRAIPEITKEINTVKQELQSTIDSEGNGTASVSDLSHTVSEPSVSSAPSTSTATVIVKDEKSPPNQPLALQQHAWIDELLTPFRKLNLFKTQYLPPSEVEREKIGRLKFTTSEDKLLAIGLERFGTNDWESIRTFYLPTKTTQQLHNRYKNMTSKRANDDNPIKAFKLIKNRPLTSEEEILLREGIRLYGYDWDAIAKKLFPHRKGSALKKYFLQKTPNVPHGSSTTNDATTASSLTEQKQAAVSTSKRLISNQRNQLLAVQKLPYLQLHHLPTGPNMLTVANRSIPTVPLMTNVSANVAPETIPANSAGEDYKKKRGRKRKVAPLTQTANAMPTTLSNTAAVPISAGLNGNTKGSIPHLPAPPFPMLPHNGIRFSQNVGSGMTAAFPFAMNMGPILPQFLSQSQQQQQQPSNLKSTVFSAQRITKSATATTTVATDNKPTRSSLQSAAATEKPALISLAPTTTTTTNEQRKENVSELVQDLNSIPSWEEIYDITDSNSYRILPDSSLSLSLFDNSTPGTPAINSFETQQQQFEHADIDSADEEDEEGDAESDQLNDSGSDDAADVNNAEQHHCEDAQSNATHLFDDTSNLIDGENSRFSTSNFLCLNDTRDFNDVLVDAAQQPSATSMTLQPSNDTKPTVNTGLTQPMLIHTDSTNLLSESEYSLSAVLGDITNNSRNGGGEGITAITPIGDKRPQQETLIGSNCETRTTVTPQQHATPESSIEATSAANGDQIDEYMITVMPDGERITWTWQEDRKLLTACNARGSTPETFRELTLTIVNKRPEQLEARFKQLMALYERERIQETIS